MHAAGRVRCAYAFGFSEGDEPVVFVKMSETGEAEALENGFNALADVAKLPQGGARFPRPYFMGKCGGVDYYVSQCVPLRRGKGAASSLGAPEVQIESYAGPITVVSPERLAELRWVRQFWEVVDERSSFASLLRDDFQHPARCCRVHGDLTRANLITTGKEMWIIDWELSDPLGPWITDYLTFFLGERQRKMIRKPARVFSELRQNFLNGRTLEEQRDVRLAMAFLLGRTSGLGTRIVAAWEAAS